MVMGLPTRRESFVFGLLGSLTAGLFILWIQSRFLKSTEEEEGAVTEEVVRKITRRGL